MLSFFLPLEQPAKAQAGLFPVLHAHDQNHRFSIVLCQDIVMFNDTPPLWTADKNENKADLIIGTDLILKFSVITCWNEARNIVIASCVVSSKNWNKPIKTIENVGFVFLPMDGTRVLGI